MVVTFACPRAKRAEIFSKIGAEICPLESRNRERKFARVAQKKIAQANCTQCGELGIWQGPRCERCEGTVEG